MSVSYTCVGWNRQKKIYDGVMAGAVALYLAAFVGVGMLMFRPPSEISPPILLIRALGTCALIMLHVVLCIGPLCRLDRRLLPLLYNRRHLGVMTFLVGLAHAAASLVWYHGFGNVNPLLSLLSSNTRFDSFTQFPFEVLGAIALLILFLMAATSHDFWLKNLSPRVWKNVHMLVYFAYALLVMHVALGFLQAERNPGLAVMLGTGAVIVIGLHIAAGWREVSKDDAEAFAPHAAAAAPIPAGWIDVGSIDDIPESRAATICIPSSAGGERVAVYRYDGKVSAVSNVCRHQGGPLGEGKIIDGCITCPWHGYQYVPETGASPPPFDDKVSTYEVRVQGRTIWLNPDAKPPGMRVEPARIGESA